MKAQIDCLCQFILLYICASLENILLHCSVNIVTLFSYTFVNFSITTCSVDFFQSAMLNILNLQICFILLFDLILFNFILFYFLRH